MSSTINWNNTIDFIKIQLGADVNKLEVDEYKIEDIIKTVTMPEFCLYFNYIDRLEYPSDQITTVTSDLKYRYKIQNYDRQIYEIKKLYFPANWVTAFSMSNTGSPTQIVASNYALDISESLMPVRSWQFFRPDIIELTIPIGFSVPDYFVIEVGAEFLNPSEIEPSMYSAFKKLAAADVIDYIISLRTKYQQLTTPQGTINMDLGRLEQKAERFRSEAQQKLENTQPDVLWSWVNV